MDAAKLSKIRNYAKQCEEEGSHHKLIWGSVIDRDLNIKETALFKKYSLPIYGIPDKGEHFIGFEYGRINGLYDHLHYCYEGELQFTRSEVPDGIRELFEKTYPELTGSRHAIIQNVRNSHYASGRVMHGYWILNDMCDVEGSKLGHDLMVLSIDHNMSHTNSTPSHALIGINLAFFEQDDSEELADKLSRLYSSRNSKLPSREDVLRILHTIHPDIRISEIPMLCLIQTMCYCCT
jgi:hypothetical protein